jgi:YgiT-type zinc finger domain-containing protein
MVEGLQEEDTNVKCIHCQGEMKRGTTPFHVDRRGCHLLLDAVPAWVCSQCGEPYFEEKEVDAIQELVASVEERAGALALTA